MPGLWKAGNPKTTTTVIITSGNFRSLSGDQCKKSSGKNDSVFYYYKDLIRLRHEEELLTESDYQLLLEDEKVFAYLRTSEKEQWIVVANLSEDTVSTEDLTEYVSDKEDIKIANYKDRTGIKENLRPYEAFMMRIR